ncbi:MAG: UvrD-helicase domain-containing protein [Bacteroidales bacterium]|nr:UvrD-helicase domain-containing protein [Bacteroidales bacterium]
MNEEKKNAILEGLNPEQSRAVQTVDGPVLIIAGAGSGKTRVLTSRVAFVIAQGCEPWRILALTFTKKAAGEMKERIARMVGERKAHHVVMGTFHSIFVRFLREYADSIGYPKEFTIYDKSDSESAVKACVKELGLDDKTYKPRDVLARISFAKNALYLPASYRNNREFTQADARAKKPQIADIYALYQQKLKQSGVMDFDDILVNMNVLLKENAAALQEIASRFSYIMVDEYQDTNYAQYLILKKLAAPHSNICVVGDDSQSIYAFRGAQIQNILNFRKDYPNSVLIRLERNYRSTRNIVDAANSVIAHNEGRIPKTCYSDGEKGEKIEFIKAYTEQEEAMLIVSDIQERMRSDRAQYEDFAILYRTNAQSRALEEQLRRKNIPYIIYSGNSFFERAEIKDMMAYFKLCVNLSDDESFKRVVNLPARGIGPTSLSTLNELARAHGCPLFKAAWLPDYEVYGLTTPAAEKIRAFCKMIEGFALAAVSGDAHEIAVRIATESGMLVHFKEDTSIEGMARTANVEELLNSVASFVEERQDDIIADMEGDESFDESNLPVVTMADFLENTALLTNIDASEGEDTNNKVGLMTVHSAKGLEFPYVYIAGAEENLFPSGTSLASPADIEEERRLFYVALTRAKKAVKVSFAQTRMRNGQHESNPPSRFVREIDEKYVENPLGEDSFGYDQDSAMFRRFGFGGNGGGYSTRITGSSSKKCGFGGYFSRHPGPDPGSKYGQSSKIEYFRRKASEAPAQHGPYGRAMTDKSSPRGTLAGPLPNAGARRGPIPTVKPPVIDANFVPEPMTAFKAGERIEHNRFGAGLVVEITGVVPELKATIDFDDYGRKLLLLKYAKMRHEKK